MSKNVYILKFYTNIIFSNLSICNYIIIGGVTTGGLLHHFPISQLIKPLNLKQITYET